MTTEKKAALRQRYERLRKAIAVELGDDLTLHVRPLMIDEKEYVDELNKKGGDEAMIAAWLLCEEDGSRLQKQDRDEYEEIFKTGSRGDYSTILNAASQAGKKTPQADKKKGADEGN